MKNGLTGMQFELVNINLIQASRGAVVDAPPFPSLLRSSQSPRQTSGARAQRWLEGGEVRRARRICGSEAEQRTLIRSHCVRASAHNAQASERSGHQWPTEAVAESWLSGCHFKKRE